MIVDKIFRENMLIEVFDEEHNIYYKSLIQGVDDDSFIIGVPMKGKKQLIMREKNSYNMRVALGDALYCFTSRMLGRSRSGNIPLFVLEWPGEIKRSQRRQFFRLAISLEAHYWVLPKVGIAADDTLQKNGNQQLDLRQPLNKLVTLLGEPSRCIVTDLSGGGMALVVNHFMAEGSLLAIRLSLKSKKIEKEMLLKARVIRCYQLEGARGWRRYRLGLEFEDMMDRARDELINLIFTLSRERAHQGGGKVDR